MRSVSEKAAEFAQKQERQKKLMQLQERVDLELMRLTRTFDPLHVERDSIYLSTTRW